MTMQQDILRYHQDLIKGHAELENFSKSRLTGKIAMRLKSAVRECLSSIEEILEVIPVKNQIEEPAR